MIEVVERKFPIAETFTSVQGEGVWVGTRMTFIRLAGCNVGRPYPKEVQEEKKLPVYTECCSLWKGEMACDTDYRRKEFLTPEEILHRVNAPIVCITGGEPLLHPLIDLVSRFMTSKRIDRIHLETSGTKDIKPLTEYITKKNWRNRFWVAVSPKRDFLADSLWLADEIKVIIDKAQFDEGEFERLFGVFLDSGKIFFQPFNQENEVNMDNLNFCLKLQEKYPKVKLSSQLHKFISVR